MLKGSSIFGIDCVNGSLISHRYNVVSRLVCSFEKGTNSSMLTSFDPIYLICWQYSISISDDNENYDECFVIMLMTTTGGEGWLGPGPGWGRLWWPTGRAGGRSTSSSLSSSPYHTIILMTIVHCHRFNIGAGNSLYPEIDDLQSGQSESFLSHLVVHMFEINCCARTKKWFDQSLPKINLIIILKAWAHTRLNFTKLQKTLLWLIACLSFHICTKLCLIFCLTLDFHLCFDRVLPDPESCFGELHLI